MSAPPEASLIRAREFYRDPLARSFRYSRQISEPLGIVPEVVLDTPEFEGVVRECEIGSLDGARRIGEMVVVYLDRLSAAPSVSDNTKRPGNWWQDLLNFERGCFLQAATITEGPPTNRPRRGVSALCMNFGWAMSELVERIGKNEDIGRDLRRPVTLVFARARDGRVVIVEVGPAVEKVFRATNGLRPIEQIAASAGVSLQEAQEILSALAETGAVVLAMSSEEMNRLIKAREK